MVIGDFLGYSSLGLGSTHGRGAYVPPRQAVTLDAKMNPKAPNEYSVQLPPEVIEPPQKASDAKPAAKKLNQNNDRFSRAFLSVADFKPRIHNIDIKV